MSKNSNTNIRKIVDNYIIITYPELKFYEKSMSRQFPCFSSVSATLKKSKGNIN